MGGLQTLESTPVLNWYLVPTQGLEPSPRGYASMVVLQDQALLYGGADSRQIFSDVWALDLKEFTWKELESHLPRMAHSACAMGPLMWVLGGCAGQDDLNTIHLFDSRTLTWMPDHYEFPMALGYHMMVAKDQQLYVYGGYHRAPLDKTFVIYPGLLAHLF